MPPLLLGLPGDNTYSNYQEANRTFWRQTLIPLAARTAKALSGWLGAGLVLRPDLDQLDALAPDREALWARLDGASFLTDDEKRAEAGYGPRAGGDGGLVAKLNPNYAADGRFDFSPDGGVVTPVAGKPRGPAPPPPAAPKPPPAAPTTKPGTRDPSKEPLKDMLMPGGKELGVRSTGAADNIRTVSKAELDALKDQVLAGAKEIVAPQAYEGKWYLRPDATIVGIRESASSGTTIDVVKSNNPSLTRGYKVHGK